MSKMETANIIGSNEKIETHIGVQKTVCANQDSEVTTNVLVSCETTNTVTDLKNTIIVSVPNSNVENVNSVDCKKGTDLKNTEECKALKANVELKNEIHCDTKVHMQPVSLVCEPDIVNGINSLEGNNKKNLKVAHKPIPVSKRGILCKSIISEKRKKEDKKGLRKRKRPSQALPKALKKKPKQIRDLEKTLNCLLSDSEQVKDEKACAFAQSYFLKVTETLYGKDDATYHNFLKTMNDFGTSIFEATELYKKVTKIFEGYPELAEEFLAFLLPEQAMECGKFMEYIILTKMNSFCRKLEVYYAKQPSQLSKIYSSLAALAANNEATMDDLRNTILPLLKNNSLLVNMFLELMPTEAPHASSLNYYECMDLKRANLHKSEANSEDWFETIEVPPPVEDNMYGGEDCVCSCHLPSDNSKRQPKHCISCGTKFIQGRVYIRSGGMLHPAKVSFKEMKSKVLERLSVKNLKSQKVLKAHAAPSAGKRSCGAKGEAKGAKGAKAPKGKEPGEEPKKGKKAPGEHKHPKVPRKKIRTLASRDLADVDGGRGVCKTGAVPPRKGVSKVVKAYAKTVPKCMKIDGDSNTVYFMQEDGSSNVPCESSGKSFSGDALQKCKRKQSGYRQGGGSGVEGSVGEGELILNDQGKDFGSKEEKERGEGRLEEFGASCEDAGAGEGVSLQEKNKDCGDCCCQSDADSESDNSEVTCHDRLPHVVSSASELKTNPAENMQLEGRSCVDRETTQESLNCGEVKDPSRCSVSATAMQECKLESLSCSTENLSCSEAEDILLERMELDTTDENMSSEEDKHFVDMDAMHSDSSMESNTKDSSQMDIDDSSDESESCHSSNRDSNTDSDSDQPCNKSSLLPIVPTDTSWTRDEDKVILRTFQLWNGSELVFEKICNQLPNRTADEVRLRFQALMSFLQKITGDPVLNP